ncbi:MAG: Gfo/Idh/MocA family oxidoreductase [Candidatus Bathyarchaeia archaeon]
MVVKVLMISYAHVHAASYTEQLLRRKTEVGDVEIIGVFDENRERGKYYADKYSLRLFESVEEAIKEKPDISLINTETAKHLTYVKLSAENGIHVFCEKPIGVNLKDALKIKDAVEKGGIKFTTGFNARFNPENSKAKEMVSSGELGKISMIRIRVAHSAAIDRWFRGWSEWFTIKEMAGNGGFLDLCIHGADLLRYILGDEACEVTGFISNFSSSYKIDDQGVGIIRFSRGTLGILDGGWTQVVEGIPWSPLEIYGDKGSLLRTPVGLIYYTSVQKSWVKPNLETKNKNSLDELIEAVKGDKEVSITIYDAIKAQEIMEAVYISSDKRTSIRLPLAKY